jgi:hypothetical protein
MTLENLRRGGAFDDSCFRTTYINSQDGSHKIDFYFGSILRDDYSLG